MGLSVMRRDSYEANQSFPKVQKKLAKIEVDTPEIKKTLEDFKGPNHFTFMSVVFQQKPIQMSIRSSKIFMHLQ